MPSCNYYFKELDLCNNLDEARVPSTLLSFERAFYHGSSKACLFRDGNIHNRIRNEWQTSSINSGTPKDMFIEESKAKYFVTTIFESNRKCSRSNETLTISQFINTGECQNSRSSDSFGYLDVLTKKQEKLLAEAVIKNQLLLVVVRSCRLMAKHWYWGRSLKCYCVLSDGVDCNIAFQMIESVPAKYKNMTEVERYREGKALFEPGNAVGVQMYLVNSCLNTSANNEINQLRRRKKDKNLIEGATKDELGKWAKGKNKTILSLEDQKTDLDDLLNPELERALQPDKLWSKDWELHHFVAMRNRESKNVSNYKRTKLSHHEIKTRHDENLKKKG